MSDKRLTVDDLSPDQREVYDAMISWRGSTGEVLTLGAYGGCGKTALLGVFAKNTPLKVAYVTFTGRASSILQRKLRAAGVETTNKTMAPLDRGSNINREYSFHMSSAEAKLPYCGTIHRLLYAPVIDQSTEEILGFRKRDELDRKYDLIAIDEASMISQELLEDLQAHETPILAVGDHGQLPPVGAAGGLMKNPILRLEKIHRQAEGSPIIQLGRAVREEGRLSTKYADGHAVRFLYKSKAEDVLREIYAEMKPLDVGVLCWTNRNRCMLNKFARKALGHAGSPRKDEVVLALKNKPPVYNGMRGILSADSVKGYAPWHLDATINFPDEQLNDSLYIMNAAQFFREKTYANVEELRERGIDVNRMSEGGELFDFGYCLTTHRAQGSQFERAVYYTDMPESHPDWRAMAYTSISRAVSQITVLR